MVVEQLDNIIKNSKNILLISHINPDGDTLGSMCAMYSLIKDNFKKECDMVAVSDFPITYKFLPNSERVKHISHMDLSREYDLAISLDVADIERCSDARILFEKAKTKINIDHHQTNIGFGDVNIIENFASATAEVLFNICDALNWNISQESAIGLYVGILTDTGGFRFSNTSAKTLQISSKLILLGANPSEIYQKCYESNSKNMVLFQSYCVNKANFVNDDKIAYIVIYKKDFEKFHNDGEDFTEGLTEKLRAIKTTEIAFVVKELGVSLSKVSMRSRTKDIAQVCSEFGGGGHKLAAGAVIKMGADDAVRRILDVIKEKGLC